MILKVKKAEFLTDARWEFKHGNQTIPAKIHHTEWLKDYQAGRIPVLPGDALQVVVRTEARYDHDMNLIRVSYDILTVIDVIRPDIGEQPTLLLQ